MYTLNFLRQDKGSQVTELPSVGRKYTTLGEAVQAAEEAMRQRKEIAFVSVYRVSDIGTEVFEKRVEREPKTSPPRA